MCDLGAGEYTKEYFGAGRYDIFCNRSESHNVPIIGGRGQRAGREFSAASCRFDTENTLTLDIAGAYGIQELTGLERSFSFDIDTGCLALRDCFRFLKALPVTERFVSLFPPRIQNGTVRIDLPGSGGSFWINCHAGKTAEIQQLEHRDHGGRPVPVYAIDFLFAPDTNSFSVEFTFSPETNAV